MKQLFRRNQVLGQFTGMKSNVDLGIKLMEEIQHLHMPVEIMDRDIPVFRHHQIQADDARVF